MISTAAEQLARADKYSRPRWRSVAAVCRSAQAFGAQTTMHENTVNEAIKLWHLGKFEMAKAKLSPLLQKRPSHPVINGLLGAINYQQQRYRKAYHHFAKTVEHSPASETALRGMVHSALRLGWHNCALKAADSLAKMTCRKDDVKLARAIRGA